MRVGRGVGEHVARQRALGPVGALVGLVELEREVALEQRREADRLVSEELRADHRVDEVRRREAEVAVEDA